MGGNLGLAAARRQGIAIAPVQIGPRGGKFYITSGGTKVYGEPPVGGRAGGGGTVTPGQTSGSGDLSGKRQWTSKLPVGIKHDETWKTHFSSHPDHGGHPSENRKREVHDHIVREALVHVPSVPRGEPKIAIMTMGAPASGKSSSLRGMDTSKHVKVDPDEIKGKLPEYKIATHPGATYRKAAAMAHEESSYVARRILARAIAENKNVIVDGTGANAESFMKKMASLRAAGYHIHVVGTHVEEKVGILRLRERAEKSGRMVPIAFARQAYHKIPRNFELIARHADSFSLHDNSGSAPKKIWSGEKGKADMHHDPAAVQEFRKKYSSHG